ncbi:protein ninH [Erwinia sp. E602]|uniref:protein ninH n=1 Tax=Erwinia sp. E602 TaxID=2675378 RepID=UPI001BA54D13|nr:protein ninH [Erwinia sp. E602]QUG75992.1 protein ninH [Erwinia sp. E602]
MIGTLSTIPELLVVTRGNQTEAARQLNSNRATVKKYSRDFQATHHAIVNGVLMIYRGQLGEHKRRKP